MGGCCDRLLLGCRHSSLLFEKSIVGSKGTIYACSISSKPLLWAVPLSTQFNMASGSSCWGIRLDRHLGYVFLRPSLCRKIRQSLQSSHVTFIGNQVLPWRRYNGCRIFVLDWSERRG